MEKLKYAKMLAQRLITMLDENEQEKGKYRAVWSHLPAKDDYHDPNYDKAWNKLTQAQKDTYWRGGVKHSTMAIQRVRIELNKVLIEVEKDGGYNE